MLRTITLASLQAYLAMATDEQTTCEKEGGEWRTHWWYADKCVTLREKCEQKKDGSVWDENYEVCLSEEERKKVCLENAGEWKSDNHGWYCKTAYELCKAKTDGSFWDFKKEVCVSGEVYKKYCEKKGSLWISTVGRSWCDGDLLNPPNLAEIAGEDHVGAMSLAQADAHTESNNYSNMYAGAAFGVVGLAATFVLISTCSKQEVSERHSAILDGFRNTDHL